MLSRMFPTQLDNDYRGYQAALWLLVLFLLVRTFAGVGPDRYFDPCRSKKFQITSGPFGSVGDGPKSRGARR